MSKTTNKYTPEVRDRAVQMVLSNEALSKIQVTSQTGRSA